MRKFLTGIPLFAQCVIWSQSCPSIMFRPLKWKSMHFLLTKHIQQQHHHHTAIATATTIIPPPQQQSVRYDFLPNKQLRQYLAYAVRPGFSASRVGGSLTLAWAARAGYVLTQTCYYIVKNFWCAKIFILSTRSGTYPAQTAQASVKLPPTLEADKPVLDGYIIRQA